MPHEEIASWRVSAASRRQGERQLGERDSAWVIDFDGRRVGRCILETSAQGHDVRLHVLETEPVALGQDFWARLVALLEARARAVGARTLRMKATPALLPLLQPLGFAVTLAEWRRPGDLQPPTPGDDAMTARVMTREEHERFAQETRAELADLGKRSGIATSGRRGPTLAVDSQQDPDQTFLIMEHKGQAVGRAWLTRVRDGDHVDVRVQMVDILSEYRGSGLLTPMLDELQRYMARLGARHVISRSFGDPKIVRQLERRGNTMRIAWLRKDLPGSG